MPTGENRMQFPLVCLFILLCLALITLPGANANEGNATRHPQLAHWNWDSVKLYVAIVIFLMLTVVGKSLFGLSPFLISYVPESCLLIVIGLVAGGLVRVYSQFHHADVRLTPNLFLYLLLPPIVLESAYTLHNRVFLVNLVAVLIFAVLGTVLNFFFIAGVAFILVQADMFGKPHIDPPFLHLLQFSALIVAVDPVAVLAIFADIGVDATLYFIVFGESLLNDAVTLVLFDGITDMLQMPKYGTKDILITFGSFFTVSLGGVVIGAICGLLTAMVTRLTNNLSMVTPMAVLSMAYMSYVLANLFGWSGIISLVVCGLLQSYYAFNNMDHKTEHFIHKFCSVLAITSEAIIFVFLGNDLLVRKVEWHIGFTGWIIILCLVSRGVFTVLQTLFINHFRLASRRICWSEVFILTYGGLRGAVAYCLATTINPKLWEKTGLTQSQLLGATLSVILFTVVIMGCTVKPIVITMGIKLCQPKPISLFGDLNKDVLRALLANMERIAGDPGFNARYAYFNRLEDKYIKPVLLSSRARERLKIINTYDAINITENIAVLLPRAQAKKVLEKLPRYSRKRYLTMHTSLFGGVFSETVMPDDEQEVESVPTVTNVSRPSSVTHPRTPQRPRVSAPLTRLGPIINDELSTYRTGPQDMHLATLRRFTKRSTME